MRRGDVRVIDVLRGVLLAEQTGNAVSKFRARRIFPLRFRQSSEHRPDGLRIKKRLQHGFELLARERAVAFGIRRSGEREIRKLLRRERTQRRGALPARHRALRAEQPVFVGKEKRCIGVEHRPRQRVIYYIRFDRLRRRIDALAGFVRPRNKKKPLRKHGGSGGSAAERDALGLENTIAETVFHGIDRRFRRRGCGLRRGGGVRGERGSLRPVAAAVEINGGEQHGSEHRKTEDFQLHGDGSSRNCFFAGNAI